MYIFTDIKFKSAQQTIREYSKGNACWTFQKSENFTKKV